MLHQSDEQLLREEDILEKLSEREKFRDAFCTNIIEGVSEALVVETSADFQKKSDIPETEAKRRAAERMKIFTNFPVSILVYSTKRKSSHLTAALQVGNYYFEWNKTSVIMPKKVENLTAKQPVLRLGVPQEGVWPSFVNAVQSRISEALEKLDYDTLIQLQYELACRKDELLYALIDVCVRYNRANTYRNMNCNNSHFIRDAQLALGIAQPSKISRGTIQDHLKRLTQMWKKLQSGKVKFESHSDLDTFVEDTVVTETMPQEGLEYLMSKYFLFHVSGWDQHAEDRGTWSCAGIKCMLKTVEDSVKLCMW